MFPTESRRFENIAATTAAFQLKGGKYSVAAVANFGGGNVVLQILGPDSLTWLPAHTALTAAGLAVAEVPPCQARVAITTATAVYVTVTTIPS